MTFTLGSPKAQTHLVSATDQIGSTFGRVGQFPNPGCKPLFFNILRLSPYSAIFYGPDASLASNNFKYFNNLAEIQQQHFSTECRCKSLFLNILRASPYFRIFCEPNRRTKAFNSNHFNNLWEVHQKNWWGVRGRMFAPNPG